MKKYTFLFVILLVPWAISAQSQHDNYISTQHPISSTDTLTTIEYFDGLGRSSETIKKVNEGQKILRKCNRKHHQTLYL